MSNDKDEFNSLKTMADQAYEIFKMEILDRKITQRNKSLDNVSIQPATIAAGRQQDDDRG